MMAAMAIQSRIAIELKFIVAVSATGLELGRDHDSVRGFIFMMCIICTIVVLCPPSVASRFFRSDRSG